jgi:hypothetical protein
VHLALVVFLEEPLPSPEEAVLRMCRDALAADVQPDPDADDPTAAARVRFANGDQSFRVTVWDRPWPDGAELTPHIESPGSRERFRGHRAYLAIEWIESGEVPDFEAAYLPISRVLARACDTNAIAIFTPQWDRVQVVTPETAEALRCAQPLLGFGILHTRLGCLIREDTMWLSLFPTRWGPVQISASGGPSGPPRERTDRMREIAEHKLRYLRAKLLFSLFYRPCQVLLDKHGEISVEYRNWLTGTRRHFVSATDVPI